MQFSHIFQRVISASLNYTIIIIIIIIIIITKFV